MHWRAAALACSLLMATVPAYAATPASPSVDTLALNIPAQQLRQALLVFSQQSGQNVLLDGNLDGALRSSAVVGVYAPEQALAELLKGSGYSFARTDAVTVYLVPVPRQVDGMTLPAIHVQDYAGQDGGPSVGYLGKPKSTTTRLGLTDKQTPQAITVVTREQLDDFKLNSVKEALRSAPEIADFIAWVARKPAGFYTSTATSNGQMTAVTPLMGMDRCVRARWPDATHRQRYGVS